MKSHIQAQIKCGGLSPEGMFFKAARAAGLSLAGLIAVSTVKDDNGEIASIGIRIDGTTQFEATVNSGDLDRIVIHNPDWKAGPQNKENIK